MRRVVEGLRLQAAAAAALVALLVVAVHGVVLEDEIKSLPYYVRWRATDTLGG